MRLKILNPFITPPFYKRIIYFFIISITSDIDFKLFANLSKSSRLLIVILKCISIRLFPFSLKEFVFTFKGSFYIHLKFGLYLEAIHFDLKLLL